MAGLPQVPCPSCGRMNAADKTRCPTCGYEFVVDEGGSSGGSLIQRLVGRVKGR